MKKDDIKQVLETLGSTKFRESGESLQSDCPLAPFTHEGGHDTHPSFGVKEVTGASYCHCFTCAFSGTMISLVREYGKYALPEGLITHDKIKEIVDFIFIAEDEEVEYVPDLVEMPKPAKGMVDSIGVWHNYFAERDIDKDTFDLWDLGYYKEDQRIMFPVFDTLKTAAQKEPIGIVGRAISSDAPAKYKNYPPKFKKSMFLYGLWLKQKANTLIVVEGPIDAIKVNKVLSDYNYTDYWCVALLGAEPSKAQLDLLVDNADEIVCMLDNDSSGKKGTQTLNQGIYSRTVLSVVEYPDGKNDPDEAFNYIIDMLGSRITMLEWQLRNKLAKEGVVHGKLDKK